MPDCEFFSADERSSENIISAFQKKKGKSTSQVKFVRVTNGNLERAGKGNGNSARMLQKFNIESIPLDGNQSDGADPCTSLSRSLSCGAAEIFN